MHFVELAVAQTADLEMHFFAERRGGEAQRVLEERFEFGAGLLGGYSGLEAAEGPERASGIGSALGGDIERLREQHICGLEARHFEAGRQDADNLAGLSVDADGFADYGGI